VNVFFLHIFIKPRVPQGVKEESKTLTSLVLFSYNKRLAQSLLLKHISVQTSIELLPSIHRRQSRNSRGHQGPTMCQTMQERKVFSL
jgi:hypothetical protein